MKSDTVIDALANCRSVLINVIHDKLQSLPGKSIDISVCLPILSVDYDLTAATEEITTVSLENDTIMVYYEDYYKQYKDPVELFSVDELVKIIDKL